MTQVRPARESFEAKPSLLRSRPGGELKNNNSLFDIFTIDIEGRAQFVLSVTSSLKAQETARRLSRLMPGEFFGYFERINEEGIVFERLEARQDAN